MKKELNMNENMDKKVVKKEADDKVMDNDCVNRIVILPQVI